MRSWLIVLCLALVPGLVRADAPKVSRINDQTGKLIKAAAALDTPAKKANLEPFVVGVFAWKALHLAEIGVDKYIGQWLNVCRIAVTFYVPDASVDNALTALTAKGKTDDLAKTTADEYEAIRVFVVKTMQAKYVQDLDHPKKTFDPVLAWRYKLGSTIGELSARITQWHLIWDKPTLDKPIATLLASLVAAAKDAPKGTDATVIAKLEALAPLAKQTAFTLADRQKVADALDAVLTAALVFADGPANEPARSTKE